MCMLLQEFTQAIAMVQLLMHFNTMWGNILNYTHNNCTLPLKKWLKDSVLYCVCRMEAAAQLFASMLTIAVIKQYTAKTKLLFQQTTWLLQLRDYPSHANSKNVANLLLISWPICYQEGYTYFKVSFHYVILGMTQLASH